jgi:hypothetical protein
MRAYTAVIRVYNAAGNRDSRWIGSIGRIEGIYRYHIALPSLWGQSYIRCKESHNQPQGGLCVGESPMLPSHSNRMML